MNLKYVSSYFRAEVSCKSGPVNLHWGPGAGEQTAELTLLPLVAHHQQQDSDVWDVLPEIFFKYEIRGFHEKKKHIEFSNVKNYLCISGRFGPFRS